MRPRRRRTKDDGESYLTSYYITFSQIQSRVLVILPDRGSRGRGTQIDKTGGVVESQSRDSLCLYSFMLVIDSYTATSFILFTDK